MDQQTGWAIIKSTFRCGAELQELLHLLKERCDPQEYRNYARRIATAIDAVHVQLTHEVFAQHPSLKDKIESDLEKFWRLT